MYQRSSSVVCSGRLFRVSNGLHSHFVCVDITFVLIIVQTVRFVKK